jgi:hypothetical protein
MSDMPPDRPKILRVEHPKAVKFLTNSAEAQSLSPFMREEVSLANAAREHQLDLNFLVQKAKQLLALGLIQVTRIQQRSGRPIRFYQSTAEEFFIPESTGAIELVFQQNERKFNQDLERGVINAWMKRHEKPDADWGLRVRLLDTTHRIDVTTAVRPGENFDLSHHDTLAFYSWQVFQLSDDDAQWLRASYKQLREELERRNNGQEQAYLVRMAFAPYVSE